MNVYRHIAETAAAGKKLFAVLLDPEKTPLEGLDARTRGADYVLVGGSTGGGSDRLVQALRQQTRMPVVLFPGSQEQFSADADALLFLSVMSSGNPEMLLHRQIRAARMVRESGIESIPTGYILLDGGTESSVARATASRPIPQTDTDLIVDTAIAAELTGKQLIYLEAGSGAAMPIRTELIHAVRRHVSVPIIAGGGIRTPEQMHAAYDAGADMVVVGNWLEQHPEQITVFTRP